MASPSSFPPPPWEKQISVSGGLVPEDTSAFQTADGADEDGKITLRKTHIQQIVRMS